MFPDGHPLLIVQSPVDFVVFFLNEHHLDTNAVYTLKVLFGLSNEWS